MRTRLPFDEIARMLDTSATAARQLASRGRRTEISASKSPRRGAERALTASVEGAAAVAGRALMFANPAAMLHPVVVNGGAGVIATADGRPFSLIAFTVVGGRIAEIDAIADPERLSRLVGALLTEE